MTRRLSLAHLTALHLPPPALIHAAALAGFDDVGLRLVRVTPDSPGYPLMENPAQLRATQDALVATGIRVADIEFIKITPDLRPDTLCPMLDVGAALGARHLICAPYDDDLTRLAETLGQVANLCAPRGLSAVLEFFPWTSVPDLKTCWEVVQAAGPDVGILADALHYDRSGAPHDVLALIPQQRLPFAHLCDALVHPPYSTDDLLLTARQSRLFPGDGMIDLRGFLAALPPETPLGLEVPMPQGANLPALLRTTRAFLAQL